MAHILLACPKCHAPYKIPREHAHESVMCRNCAHKWIPVPGGLKPAASEPAAAAPAQPVAPAPAKVEASAAPEAEPMTPIVEPVADPAPAAKAAAPVAAAPADPPAAPPKSGLHAAVSAKAADHAADALAALAGTVGRKPAAAKAPANSALAAVAAATKTAAAPREEKVDSLIGAQIDSFKIQSRLGSGGFGVVYRAFDTNLERSVALKVLPPKMAKAGRSLVDRFLREARSAAKLSHPNIVTIHQICPYKDTFYIVMELVDGGALHEYLATRKRFEPIEATRVIRSAAEGLAHAHLRGVIHRDIKPGNIMMTHDGQVKVSDFGLARDVMQTEDIVGPGHSLGTPRYMSPEQALGEEPTAASDLYSLAATYYVLLTGKAPYDGGSDRDIMKMHVQAPIPDPREVVPELPVIVFRFLEKAMAKEPEDRYQTAQEFIEALDRLNFSDTAGGGATPQALSAQLGPLGAEDRGSHLTEVLDRAVKRSRSATPSPSAPRIVARPQTGAKKKSGFGGWKLWLLIGLGVLLLIGAAVGVALYLAKKQLADMAVKEMPGIITPGEKTAATPSGEKGKTEKPGEKPAEKPAEKPQEKTAPKPAAPEPVTSQREIDAQEMLKSVQSFAANPDNFVGDKLENYRNLIKIFPGTKAADEAKKAIERLGRESEPAPAPPEPAPEKPPEKPAEKPADK